MMVKYIFKEITYILFWLFLLMANAVFLFMGGYLWLKILNGIAILVCIGGLVLSIKKLQSLIADLDDAIKSISEAVFLLQKIQILQSISSRKQSEDEDGDWLENFLKKHGKN